MIITPQTLGIGINDAVLLQPAGRQELFSRAVSLGTATARVEVPWVLVNDATWASNVAPMFSDLKNSGIDPLVVIGHPPNGASPTALGLFAQKLLSAFPQIKALEIYNETNLSPFWSAPKDYAALLQGAYKAIKQARPDVTVVLGGLAACATFHRWGFWFWPAVNNMSPDTYLTQVHDAGAKESYDVLGYHPYSLNDNFSVALPTAQEKYIAMVNTLSKITDKPIWTTEFGFQVGQNGITPEAQALYLQQELNIINSDVPVQRAYVYSLHDNNGEKFGLYDATLTARPSAQVFRGAFT